MNSLSSRKKIREFLDFGKAVNSFVRKELTYSMIKHVLKKGEEIEHHRHKKANEWIVISNGHLEVEIDGQRQELKIYASNGFTVIFFPKTIEHFLSAKSDVSYFVFRDRKDRSVYTRRSKIKS